MLYDNYGCIVYVDRSTIESNYWSRSVYSTNHIRS